MFTEEVLELRRVWRWWEEWGTSPAVCVCARACSLSVLVRTYELLKVCLSCTCYLEEVSALREFNKGFSSCCSGCSSFLEGCGGMFHNHPGTDWELLLGKLGKQVTWVRLCFNIWTPVGHGSLLTSTEVASCSSQGCCGEGWRCRSAEAHSVLPPLVLRFSFSCWYWLITYEMNHNQGKLPGAVSKSEELPLVWFIIAEILAKILLSTYACT